MACKLIAPFLLLSTGFYSVIAFSASLSLDAVLQTAARAARAGGRIMRDNMGAQVVAQKANWQDVVTAVDMESEAEIRRIVAEDWPGHAFLGEEEVGCGQGDYEPALEAALRRAEETAGGWLWIVDPVDGTANFAFGQPMCVVSVGVWRDGESVAGAVYNPSTDELWTATRGGGAWLNGERIAVRGDPELRNALLNCGFPASGDAQAAVQRGMVRLAPEVRGLRMYACAALTLCWIACGRLSGYFSLNLNSWDIAAGELILSEAGGRLTDLDGEPYTCRTRDLLATSGPIHDDTLRLLQDAGVV